MTQNGKFEGRELGAEFRQGAELDSETASM